ncbi:helix-turn-helix domain-containing protein [Antribacter sp. KLBMP9083]|uniref:Helix-turn-helix domain-containing protein n=1 Tax=Antribacter soli TaxID=2910976 RepID=A0AA41QFG9_9MICO|nr:helix-turn-helix domain-containing protein [Antribacter soli]MCF4122182.1 helix-turn-helix domain-containing protein [Antribacter soli]
MTAQTIRPVRAVPVLLTPQEVADMLRIPVRTLYGQRSAGRPTPPGVKIGRHLRYRLADVEAWIDEQFGRSAA